jgi:hypothetical protein
MLLAEEFKPDPKQAMAGFARERDATVGPRFAHLARCPAVVLRLHVSMVATTRGGN